MTSIVITPFDSEHAEEYKAFIENEIDNADFEVDMPACVELLDVRHLQYQRDNFIERFKEIIDELEDHPDAENPYTKVHFALGKARGAISK